MKKEPAYAISKVEQSKTGLSMLVNCQLKGFLQKCNVSLTGDGFWQIEYI